MVEAMYQSEGQANKDLPFFSMIVQADSCVLMRNNLFFVMIITTVYRCIFRCGIVVHCATYIPFLKFYICNLAGYLLISFQ
jgi:hypothetical protein